MGGLYVGKRQEDPLEKVFPLLEFELPQKGENAKHRKKVTMPESTQNDFICSYLLTENLFFQTV